MELDIDELRKAGVEPQWFGLGFIQMKLNETDRLHFWHPDLSPDVSEEEVHDHRYDFTSTVLKGEVTHEIFVFNRSRYSGDNIRHEMVTVSCDPNQPPPPNTLPTPGVMNFVGSQTMVEGSRYFFPKGSFHRSKASRAITFLRRGPVDRQFAHVIRPVGAPMVCPFSKPKSQAEIWDHIADLIEPKSEQLAEPGYHLRSIRKGVVGEPSKIFEEAEEFMDAVRQNVDVMALVELSDLVGAIELYLEKYHSSMSLADLKAMSDVTQRAFKNGRR
jgi:phosphoribosyl-ATP pyrophosphohydrolase